MSRPAIVLEPALEVFLLCPRLIVDRLRGLRVLCGKIAQLRVVAFRAAGERIDHRNVGQPEMERGDRAAVVRRQQRGIAVGCEVDFVAAVGVQFAVRR
jgi:hypothetical protein